MRLGFDIGKFMTSKSKISEDTNTVENVLYYEKGKIVLVNEFDAGKRTFEETSNIVTEMTKEDIIAELEKIEEAEEKIREDVKYVSRVE